MDGEGMEEGSLSSKESTREPTDSVLQQVALSTHHSQRGEQGTGRRKRTEEAQSASKVFTQSCLKLSAVPQWITQFCFRTSNLVASLHSPLPVVISLQVHNSNLTP